MRDFALIQLSPGRLFVGWGPFRPSSSPVPGEPAFYLNDFFLGEKEPWQVPATWEMLGAGELGERLGLSPRPGIRWAPPDFAPFQSLFRSAHSAIEAGRFSKIVPVTVEEGTLDSGVDPAPWLARGFRALAPPLQAYAVRLGKRGMAGATPELLFRLEGRRVETMALAGTRGASRAAELLTDAKERLEHDIVIRDIEERLGTLGPVVTGETGLLMLPSLAHLKTPIVLEAAPDFETLISRLHPTPALGSSPRNDEARAWLRQADQGIERGWFGAPFGLLLPDGTGVALVAIRNVAWIERRIRIASGVGVVQGSREDHEWKELARKRLQVKMIFGLEDRATE